MERYRQFVMGNAGAARVKTAAIYRKECVRRKQQIEAEFTIDGMTVTGRPFRFARKVMVIGHAGAFVSTSRMFHVTRCRIATGIIKTVAMPCRPRFHVRLEMRGSNHAARDGKERGKPHPDM